MLITDRCTSVKFTRQARVWDVNLTWSRLADDTTTDDCDTPTTVIFDQFHQASAIDAYTPINILMSGGARLV